MLPFPVKGLGLVLDEFKAQQQSKMKTSKVDESFIVSQLKQTIDEDSNDDDDEDYETDSQEGNDPYSFYNEEYADSEVDDDEEYKNDPIYLTDLTVAIKSWMQGLHQNRPVDVNEIAGLLSASHRTILQELL